MQAFTKGLITGLSMVLLIGGAAQAAGFSVVYIVNGHQESDASKAVLAAASGQVVYKCTTVEAKVSKSGTSIGLRTKKKSLTKEQIDQQVQDLKSRAE